MIYKIELKNYRCYSDYSRDFTDKLNILAGPNGIGKTTIVEAIAYALFGNKATRGKANDWIRTGYKHGKVKLYIDDYIILRGDNEQYVEHIDGTLLARQHTGLDEWIEATYGLDADLYGTSNYIAQKDIESFTSLQSAERIARVEKLLRIDILDKLKQNVKEQAKPIRKEVEELQIKLGNIEEPLDSVHMNNNLKILLSDLLIMEGHYKKALKDFGAYTKALELYTKKETLEEKVSKIVYSDIKQSTEELFIIKQKLLVSIEAEKQLYNYNDIISDNKSIELDSMRERCAVLNNKIDELKNITENCPTCGQSIPNAAALKRKLTSYKKEFKTLTTKGIRYKKSTEKYTLEKSLYISNHDLDTIEKMLEDIQLLPYIKELESYSNVSKPKKVDITQITTDYSDLAQKVKEVETDINQQEKLSILINTYKEDYDDKQKLLNKMESFIDFIDKYRKEFTQNIIPLIENNAAKIFHYLTDNKYPNFLLQKDYSLDNYDKLSGSESDCASLALRMAIAKISRIGSFNSMLLDEVASSFDNDKEELLLDLLKLSDNQLIYISHGEIAK